MDLLYTLLGVIVGCWFLYLVSGDKFSDLINTCLDFFEDY